MNDSKRKVALRTLLIVSIICVLAFAGLLIGTIFVTPQAELNGNFKFLYETSLGAYIYPFDKAQPFSQAFATFYTNNGANPLIFSIVALALSGIIFIMLVVGIIVAAVKKKGGYIAYAVMLLLLIAIVALGLGYGPYLFGYVNLYFVDKDTTYLTAAILGFLALLFGGLALIFIVVTYSIGLYHITCKQETVGDDSETHVVIFDEQPPVLPEEVVSPEVTEQHIEEADQTTATLGNDYIPTVEPEPEPDPIPETAEEAIPVEPEPIPEPQSDETNNHVNVNINNTAPQSQQQQFDANSLAALLRDVVRDIVRDEIARNNVNQPKISESTDKNGNQTLTGATFGGPLVVQYFNGGINGVTPTPAPAPVEEKKEEPKPEPVEEKKEEPAPAKEEEKKEPESLPEPTPAPVVVPPEPTPAEPKQEYERLSFAERLLQSDKEILDLYNELKNEILSYGVKSRISAVGDTFRLHKKMYVRITVAGKSLKLYFALDPEDYKNSKIPVQNAGHKGMYAEIPLCFKVRSGLSVRRCKELIQDTMDKDGLEQGEIGKVNWAKELKAEMAAGKKKSNDDDDD
ncbi:MAG: hypothetical protein K5925_02595 [Bacilli bacterium]|nr:hypothetical protein [Bacilli bacterium]